MRELTTFEIKTVSGANNLIQFLFPSATAQFSRNPIGGSPESQIMYGNSINMFRNQAYTTGVFLGPRGIDFGFNFAMRQSARYIFPDPYNY